MAAIAPLQCELPRRPDAPAVARRLLERQFGGSLPGADLETVKLLASELVSNAVRHGAGKIVFGMRMHSAAVRICVSDEGDGFGPPPGPSQATATGKWGLAIVEVQATRWGARSRPTMVWFELEPAGEVGD